jgi:CheY-like chemotaxis protein
MKALQGLRVLVVDDNATNRQILEQILHNWGLTPVAVSRASRALHELDAARRGGSPFPLMITDVHMPEMDGFQLVSAVRDRAEFRDLRLILLSSAASPDDARKCRELEVGAYLTKPVKQSELLDAILAVMGTGAAHEETAGEVREPAGSHAQRPLRVLLAEDSPANQRLAIGLLTRRGHHVTLAETGEQAVALYESEPFDLILMDVEMPHMDGLQATRLIRRWEQSRQRHTPIIAMTAHAMAGDRERCLQAGMDDYIAKPIRLQALYERLRRLVPAEPAEENPEEA